MSCTQEFTWRRDDGTTAVSTCDGDAQRSWEGEPVCDSCFAELLDQAHEFDELRCCIDACESCDARSEGVR